MQRRQASVSVKRGQSLVEFVIILPLLLTLIGGIIQYGAILATRHALIQVSRDAGRWAATQVYTPCSTAASAAPPQPLTEADALAQQSRLMGYAAGDWNAASFTAYPNNTALPATPPGTEGVEVVWSYAAGQPCPTTSSTQVAWVTVRLSHRAPVFLPGFAYLPGLGTCDSTGCYLVITSTSRFRMEAPSTP